MDIFLMVVVIMLVAIVIHQKSTIKDLREIIKEQSEDSASQLAENFRLMDLVQDYGGQIEEYDEVEEQREKRGIFKKFFRSLEDVRKQD